MPTLAEALSQEKPVYGYYPHLNPKVANKPDTLNTPEARGKVAEALLSVAPGSGEAMSARDAWNASGRAGEALTAGNYGQAASEYGNLATALLGAVPGAGVIARGTKRGAEWMNRNLPEGVNRLADALAPKNSQDTLYAIPAWHGSPHDFDKFDMSKVGAGEGAQVYGHGLYFAESPEVAKSYRDALGKWSVAGKETDDPMLGTFARAKLDGELDQSEAHQRNMIRVYTEKLNGYEAAGEYGNATTARIMIDDANDNLARIQAVRNADVSKGGKLYHTELDVEPEDLLDWDKPLNQQSENVAAKLKGILKSTDGMPKEWIESSPGAEQRLREAGIPGIRYLDQFSRGAEGTRNYVIFDDNLVKILNKE
jgi:hypothetical protein